MRVVQIEQFGSADVTDIVDVVKPVPGAGQLLVKLKASSVNPVDVQIRQGHYQDITPLPFKLGFDGAGVVEAIGSDVSDFCAGEGIYFVPSIFNGQGTYADYCLVDAHLAAKIPPKLNFHQAAALSLIGSAAWEALIDRGRLTAGETVFIHAGAAGVGHIAIQIAKAVGARVISNAKKENLPLLMELGADVALDYEAEDYQKKLQQVVGEGVDLVLDTVAGNAISQAGAIIRPYGRIVSLADYCPPQDLLALWPKNAEIHLVYMSPSAERLQQLNKLIVADKLKVIVDKVFKLEEVAAAHEYMSCSGRVGKTVLAID